MSPTRAGRAERTTCPPRPAPTASSASASARASPSRPIPPTRAVALWLTTGIERSPLRGLTSAEKTVDRAPAAARAPVEHGVARLKYWRTFRRSRCGPNRMASIAKAVLTPERRR